MDSFNQKLERISSAKEAIKTSLTNKGMSPSDNIEDYAQIIDSIESGSGDVKQFSTVEEMNNSTGNKEGDLAVVYRSEVQNATVDSRFQTATFPETIVLDSAITDYLDIRYRAVDSSKMFDCWGQLNNTSFRMDCYSETGEIRIQYTSSDGITYTRTDTTGNPVDFGTEIYYERTEYWNDAIGKFIQVGGSTFEGLFNYKLGVFNYSACLLSELTVLDNKLHRGATYILVDKDKINTAISNAISYMKSEMNMTFSGGDAGTVLMKDSDTLVFMFGANNAIPPSGRRLELTIDTSTNTVTGLCTSDSFKGCMLVEFDVHTGSYIKHTFDTLETTLSGNKATTKYNQYYLLSYYNSDSKKLQPSMYCMTGASTGNRYGNVYEYESLKYVFADTQLSVTSDYVYEKEFYGKNGVEIGTLGMPDNSFFDTNAELYSKIQNQYDNLEPRVLTDDDKTINKNIYCIPIKSDGTPLLDISGVTNINSMFRGCTNLTTVPLLDTSSVTNMRYMFAECTNLATVPLLDTHNVTTMYAMFAGCKNLTTIQQLDTSSVVDMYQMFYVCKNLTTIPLLNTSNVTNMYWMFYGCSNLTTVPLLNTSKVTNMQDMFTSCTSLSGESLNNILAMCANATSYTSTKTLKYIGLISEQANKCKTLSNYSAFTSAGWTTGY